MMRTILYLFSALAVMGLASWAYQENYRTQTALREMERLQRQIAEAREALSILRAEWAYLNRPDRLRDLADLNYDRLELEPMRPESLGRVDQIAYPPQPLTPILNAMDAMGTFPELREPRQ